MTQETYHKEELPNGLVRVTRVGYKFVSDELKSRNGNLTWVVGEWQQCKGDLELCINGLHASPTLLDSLQYTYGNRWFKVEARGEIVEGDDKFVAREMRLTQEIPVKEVLVQFAILCARHCYKNYKAKYPKDTVVIGAIEAAERCWKNPTPENVSAARSAERKWQQKTLKKLISKALQEQKSTLHKEKTEG